MPEARLVERVCYPLLVASTTLTVALALVLVWSESPEPGMLRVLATTGILALGSGFLLSATRTVKTDRSPER